MTALIATLAQYPVTYDDHMGGGWGWGMLSVMLIALLFVVALLVWMVRAAPATHVHSHGPAITAETPVQILDRRLAAGEISPDEYHDRVAILTKK